MGTNISLRGWGGPIRTTGQKAWHSVYSVTDTPGHSNYFGIFLRKLDFAVISLFLYGTNHCYLLISP
jgi:hypothetical protein